MNSGTTSRTDAQRMADRIRLLRKEFQDAELQGVLELTPVQLGRFEEWPAGRLNPGSRVCDPHPASSQRRLFRPQREGSLSCTRRYDKLFGPSVDGVGFVGN